MKSTLRTLAGVCALVGTTIALGARPAHAQKYVMSVTPWAGAYIPTANTTSGLGGQITRNNSFMTGVRVTGWTKSAIGMELEGGYAPARVVVAGGTINGSRNTQVFVGDFKLMIGVSPASSSGGIFLEVGPALIRRGQDVSSEDASVSNWGGVAGLGFRVPFSRQVALRIDGEDFMYGGSWSGGPRTFQNDVVLDAGITIQF
jgi:hypothetical protein